MPVNRKLYTLEDIKNLIADFESIDPEDVKIFNASEMQLETSWGTETVENDSFIFMVDL